MSVNDFLANNMNIYLLCAEPLEYGNDQIRRLMSDSSNKQTRFVAKGLARQYFSRYWENLRINFKSNITRGLNVEDDILQLPVIQISQQTVKAAESRGEDGLKMF